MNASRVLRAALVSACLLPVGLVVLLLQPQHDLLVAHPEPDTPVIGPPRPLTPGSVLEGWRPPQGPLLADPRLLPPQRPTPGGPWQRERPADHDAAFLARHGQNVAAGQDCASCHHESSCTACHASQRTASALHPPGYLAFHGHDALRNTQSCASCHAPARFCTACHIDSRVFSDAPARPVPGFGIHPPGWLDPGSAMHHGDEARRDLMSCTSCHTGDSCASCHQYVNPHGLDFRDRCGRMLDAGAPTCAGCHTSTSTVPFEQLRTHPGCQR